MKEIDVVSVICYPVSDIGYQGEHTCAKATV